MPSAIMVLAAILLVAVVIIAVFMSRRRYLTRVGGGFDCSLFLGDDAAPGRHAQWRLGVAVYRHDCVEWYPLVPFVHRTRQSWQRPDLEIVSRAVPSDGEQFAVLPGALVVQCLVSGRDPIRLAMSPDAYTGFASWLEAAPPGQNNRIGHFT